MNEASHKLRRKETTTSSALSSGIANRKTMGGPEPICWRTARYMRSRRTLALWRIDRPSPFARASLTSGRSA